jgi:phage terminase small subunit
MAVLPNPRHERFAQELAKGNNQAEAYRLAGYAEKAAKECASRLLTDANVQNRVQELQGKAAERALISVESVTESLMRIARQAEALQDASGLSVARAAHMDAAKLNGLIVDKSENLNVNHVVAPDMPSPEEWEAEHAGETGH